MNMIPTNNKVVDLINGLVLAVVLSVSLLYSLYFSDFAEMHVRFSFLDFPIFVGEFVLAFCAGLMLVKLFLRGRERASPWHYAFMIYCLWVLIKTLHGYVLWGPLALRNAALFYYPVFFVIVYFALPQKLSDAFKFVLLTAAIVFCFVGPIHGYYVMAYFLFTTILCINIENKNLKLMGYAIVLTILFHSIREIFGESRSNVVASLSTFIFIGVMVYLMFRKKLSRKTRLIILAAILLFCAVGLWKYADKNGLKTLVSPFEILDRFNERLEYVKMKEGDFEFQEIQPRLYGDNSSGKIVSERTATFLNQEITATVVLFDQNKKVTEMTGADGFIEPLESASQEIASLASAGQKQYRSLESAFGNSVFRLLIWHDMFEQLWNEKAILGINFGKPQRSKSIEITQWAYGVWLRDGYITPHNSFLHVIYRGGIIGLGLLAVFIWVFVGMIKVFIREKSVSGCLLAGILVYWMMLANFLVVLELPYFAIPFWSLFGITLAHYHQLETVKLNENTSYT